MNTILIISTPFAFATLLSLLLTPFVRRLSIVLRIGDLADGERKLHRGFIPNLGGVAIFIAFMFAAFAAAVVEPEFYQFIRNGFWSVLLGGTLIFATGLSDDVAGLDFKQKFSLQLFAALVVVFLGGYHIETLRNPFTDNVIVLPYWAGAVLTLFWITGVCNAINLIDGMDGLAGGVTAIASAAMMVISFLCGDTVMTMNYAILFGATIGFLRYNFSPASIFMGDTGALFIGFVFACLAIHYKHKATTAVMLVVPMLVLGFPILDTLLAPIRRLLQGQHPFKADRLHLHHRLMDTFSLSQKNTVLLIYAICFLLCSTAIAVTAVRDEFIPLIISAVAAITVIGILGLGYVSQSRLNSSSGESGSSIHPFSK